MSSCEKQIDPDTRKKLVTLAEGCEFDAFIKLLGELGIEKIPTQEMVWEVARYLTVRVHQDTYGPHLRHTFIAWITASQAIDHLEPHERLSPLIQALWYVGQEIKSEPFPVSSIPSDQGAVDEAKLREVAESRDFVRILSILRASCREKESFSRVRDQLLARGLRDIVHLGQKLIYLVKSLEFLEKTGVREAESILFPAVHYMVKGSEDQEYFRLLETKLGRLEGDATRFLSNTGTLPEDEAARLERILVYQYPALVIENYVHSLRQGTAPAELFQVTLAAASQAVLGVEPKYWVFPIHGFNFAHAAWQAFEWTTHERDKLHLIFMPALLVNRMAVESLNPHKAFGWEHVDLSGCEISTESLQKSIEESNPELACALTARLLEDEEPLSRLIRCLILSAAKNDGGICFGHDLKFCHHAAIDYARSTIPQRRKILLALAYFLAQVEKDYELYQALQS